MDGASPTNAERYLAFIDNIIAGNDDAARAAVDAETFFVILPQYGRLTLDGYLEHMRSLREGTLDFGKHTVVHNVIQDGPFVAVRYYMMFTISNTIPRKIEYTGMDMATFNEEGRLVSIHVYFDLGDNQSQFFMQT